MYRFIKNSCYPIELPDLIYFNQNMFEHKECDNTIEWVLTYLSTEHESIYLNHLSIVPLEKKFIDFVDNLVYKLINNLMNEIQ